MLINLIFTKRKKGKIFNGQDLQDGILANLLVL